MSCTFRSAQLPADYAPMAELLSAHSIKPVTAQELEQADHDLPTGSLQQRTMAVDPAGAVIGYAEVYRFPNTRAGKFYITAIVESSARRQGIGSTLLTEMEAFARQHDGNLLVGYVLDTDEASLAHLHARGYETRRHGFYSSLDLTTWERGRFIGVTDSLQAAGIRLFPLAAEPGTTSQAKLYEMMSRTMVDIPGYEAAQFMSVQTWENWVLKAAGEELVIIAADGDRYVGVTILNATEDGLYTAHTSVDRAYRGRQIALGLKLASIDLALSRGVHQMTTGNDSLNAPMVAVNQKLGYVPGKGDYEVAKAI